MNLRMHLLIFIFIGRFFLALLVSLVTESLSLSNIPLEPVWNMFSLGKSLGNHDISTNLSGAMWQLFGILESGVPIDVIAMAAIHYCNWPLMPMYI